MTTDEQNISFAAYLKTRDSNPEDLLIKLKETENKQKDKQPYEDQDPRYYKYILDKADTTLVQLRFLPMKNLSVLPILTRYRHSYENLDTHRWYIDFCPTIDGFTGDPCPMCKDNGMYYNDNGADKGELRRKLGADVAKAIGGKRSRKIEYLSCIYIINDSTTPSNNGRICIWKYGKDVYEKIQLALRPSEKDIKVLGKKPVAVFDFFTGANFVLNLYRKDGNICYDRCEFQAPSKFFDGNEEQLKNVWDNIIDLRDFDSHKHFKSRDYLYKKYDYMMGRIDKIGSSVSSATPTEVGTSQESKSEVTPKVEEAKSSITSTEMSDDVIDEMFK